VNHTLAYNTLLRFIAHKFFALYYTIGITLCFMGFCKITTLSGIDYLDSISWTYNEHSIISEASCRQYLAHALYILKALY